MVFTSQSTKTPPVAVITWHSALTQVQVNTQVTNHKQSERARRKTKQETQILYYTLF